ncbi:MAG: hypothetical protein QGI49_11220 [SAR202 cluster bacterium]|nr:hypothetical protein [SAR202 cluster bacterium]
MDDLVIDETRGVTRNLNQPAKYAGNPVMIPLYPWEGRVTLYGTVWNDADGEWRMWYQGYGGGAVPSMAKDISDSPWEDLDFDASNLLYVIGYATSNNGIHWERPNLQLIDYKGSIDNNLVLSDASFANIIKDTRDPDPNRLYKSLFFEARDPAGTPNMGDGVSVAFSPDGIRWTKYEGNPVIKKSSDAHVLYGWDDLHGKYVSYCRPSVHEGNKTRLIGRSESDDFINWTDIEAVLIPDSEDPDGTEFYSMPVFKYEGHYLGQLFAYHTPPEEPQIRFAGTIDVQLASSRDGINWDRAGNRKPFIPNGPPGTIDAGEIYTARAPVVVGNELWFYYSCSASEHGITGRSGPICLAKLRLDGFVSVDAGEDAGSLITKPFRCEGGLLEINASARGGVVEVAVLDESGIQYQGYSRQECALFDGDSVDHSVTWRGKLSLEELKGNTVRLKFYLQNASLYSFTVGNN